MKTESLSFSILSNQNLKKPLIGQDALFSESMTAMEERLAQIILEINCTSWLLSIQISLKTLEKQSKERLPKPNKLSWIMLNRSLLDLNKEVSDR